MILIFKKEANNVLNKVADILFNFEEMKSLVNGDLTLIYKDYNDEDYITYEVEEEVFRTKDLSQMYFKDGECVELTEDIKRELGILPPTAEPIYVKNEKDKWVIDKDLLDKRKYKLKKDLYEIRKANSSKFNFTIQDRTFEQTFEPYDLIVIESAMRDFENGLYETVNWRFDTVNIIENTVVMNKYDLQRLFLEGKFNIVFHTIIQYLVANDIDSLETTAGFVLNECVAAKASILKDMNASNIMDMYNNLLA